MKIVMVSLAMALGVGALWGAPTFRMRRIGDHRKAIDE